MVQFTMQKPYISNIKSFLPVEAEISVTKVFIKLSANMKNSKSRGKQEVDVR